jgi:hypothetical protein
MMVGVEVAIPEFPISGNSVFFLSPEIPEFLLGKFRNFGTYSVRHHAATSCGNKNDASSPKFSMASQFEFTLFTGN